MHALLRAALASAPAAPPPPPAAGGGASLVIPGLALLALAAVAFVVSRRKAATAGRVMQILDAAPLGPRRSVVVLRVASEALVLGVSEAGIALLATRLADELVAGPATEVVEAQPRERVSTPACGLRSTRAVGGSGASSHPGIARAGCLGRLVSWASGLDASRAAATGPAPFESLLTESVEDQELRRKLQQGGVGSIR